MHHPSQPVFVPADIDPAHAKGYARLQKSIARSQQTPYRQIALALGIVTTGLLVAVAGIIRLFGGRKFDEIDYSLAECYNNVPSMALHKKIELRELAKNSISGQTLDVGCGSGIIGSILKRMTNIGPLHGVDVLPAFDQQVKDIGYDGFTASNATNMNIADTSFDSVISVCVLEHVKNLDGAMQEIHRVLRPNGRVYFTTPAPEFRQAILAHRFWRLLGLKDRAAEASDERDASSMQYHYYSAERWVGALEGFGFHEVQVTPIFSRSQLMVYDVINYQVEVPTLYFADKLQTFIFRYPRFKQAAIWSTAVICSFVAELPVRSGRHTHWAVVATRK